ncbi:biotin/lipoyl-binding protein, partial [Roseateles sp. GG27B]
MTSKHSNDGAAADQTSPQPRRYGWLLALLLLAAGLAAWWWLSRTPAAAALQRVLDVQVTSAELRPMPVLLKSVGKVVAQASVEVRAQTSGVLRQVFVQDGQRVKAGQPLFALDAQPLVA